MACGRAGAMRSDARWRARLALVSAVVVIGSAAGTAVADGSEQSASEPSAPTTTVRSDAPGRSGDEDPVDDGIDEAADVGDAASVVRGVATPAEPSVAVGLPPVPPTTTIATSTTVAVGLPPVPPTTTIAAVGLPPVPATTTIAAVGLSPVPPTTSGVPAAAATAPSTSDHRVTALAAQVADLLVAVSAGVAVGAG